jgi:hypothetical protein
MDNVGSVRVAGRIACAIRMENSAGASSGDKSELIRKRTRKAKPTEVIWPKKIYLALKL